MAITATSDDPVPTRPAPGRLRVALASWGRAVTASLATEHGWCLGAGVWFPYPDVTDPWSRWPVQQHGHDLRPEPHGPVR